MDLVCAFLMSIGVSPEVSGFLSTLILPAIGAVLVKLWDYLVSRGARRLQAAETRAAEAETKAAEAEARSSDASALESVVNGMKVQIDVLRDQNAEQQRLLEKAEARAGAAEVRAEEACKMMAEQETRITVLSTKIDVLIQATTFCPINAEDCPARRAVGLYGPKRADG